MKATGEREQGSPHIGRPWSLRRRMTLWFACTTTLFVLLIAVVSIWAIGRTTERELAALVEEELEEMKARFSVSAQTPEDVAAIVAEFREEHPGNKLAWRLWKTDTGEVWGDFGVTKLFQRADPSLELADRRIATFDDSLRWKAVQLADGLAGGILLDGSPQLRLSRKYVSTAVAFVAISGLLATLAGALLGSRVSRLMRRIAAGLRDIRDPSSDVDVDVTDAPEEVRLVADALREMLGNIRKESEAARLITSGLAHELRSPIQNLLGETEVALLRERDSGEYRAVLESHQEELRELARAIDNLVTLCAGAGSSRRAAGGESFDLGREVRFRLERERGLAQRKGVSFDLEFEGALHYQGDREAILLAIGNLVTNAIQWTDAGGRVRVELAGKVNEIEVVVDDEGPGIPVERHEEIFRPFQRSESAPGRRQGFGLGLALAHSAVEAHGGHIAVEAAPGKGTRFRITLPRGGRWLDQGRSRQALAS